MRASPPPVSFWARGPPATSEGAPRGDDPGSYRRSRHRSRQDLPADAPDAHLRRADHPALPSGPRRHLRVRAGATRPPRSPAPGSSGPARTSSTRTTATSASSSPSGSRRYELFLGTLDKAGEPFSGARQMPFHYTSPKLRMPTPSTSIATQIPHAVGAALASKIRREDAVTFCWFGDGATSKGDFHEGLSLRVDPPPADRLHLREQPVRHLGAARAPVAGPERRRARRRLRHPGQRCDGMSVQETYAAVSTAAERARAGDGPSLVEASVYRLGPHTSHDDDTRYRSREEVAAWEAREPIERLRADLLERGLLDEAADAAMHADVDREIAEALAQAEAAPDPDRSEAFRDLLADYVVPDPFDAATRGPPTPPPARAARGSTPPGRADDPLGSGAPRPRRDPPGRPGRPDRPRAPSPSACRPSSPRTASSTSSRPWRSSTASRSRWPSAARPSTRS